jgi:O-antigen/teichoic acid export membrane protein
VYGSALLRPFAVYALGLVVCRGLDFALLPLYTHYLTPDDYGAAALTLTLLAFGHVLYAFGFGPAFLRYAATHAEQDVRRMFASVTLVLAAAAGFLSAGVCLFPAPVAGWFGLADRIPLVRLAAGILFLDVFTLLPYTILRTEERPVPFVLHTLSATVVHVALTAYLVVYAGMGAEAIFIALLVSSAFNAAAVTASVRRYVRLSLEWAHPAPLLRFGLPFVPAGLATVAMDTIDRVMLVGMTDAATVGIYSAGYRVAMVMGLAVKAFEYAWAPHLLARRENAPHLAKRGLAGFVAVAGMLWLSFWLFGERLFRVEVYGKPIIGPAYQAGAAVIPPVMFAYLLAGIAEALMAHVYLRGRSWVVTVAAVLSAGVHIGGNYLLIPRFGMMGAAYATVIGYAALAGILGGYAKRGKR